MKALHGARRLADAAALQATLVAKLREAPAIPAEQLAEDLNTLGALLYALGDYATATTHFQQAHACHPGHPRARLNEALCLLRRQRMNEAAAVLHAIESIHPDDLTLLDGLAEAHGALGQLDACRAYGERALLQRDRAVTAASGAGIQVDPAALSPVPGKKDVIAFSLFGERAIYLDGALRNACVAPYVYPGWQCRFYCDDSVPESLRRELAREGAEVVMMARPRRPSEALFWRFLVAEDLGVGRFLVRDCDATLNVRERAAVGAWLDSDRAFHLMRDHPAHTDLILAGMWGGVAGLLPPLTRMLAGFSYKPAAEARNVDQIFLGRVVWPLIKPHCLIHDRIYRVFGALTFPPGYELPGKRHVGDKDAAWRSSGVAARE